MYLLHNHLLRMTWNKECTKCELIHEGTTWRSCLVEMAENGSSAFQQQSMQPSTSATSTSSISPDVALVTARNMAVDSRITPAEASSKASVNPESHWTTSNINNSADSIIFTNFARYCQPNVCI